MAYERTLPYFAAAGASAVGDTAAEGTDIRHARADHRHSREAFGTGVTATVGTANSDGAATTLARSDHVHAHEAAHINHDTTWAAKGDLIAGSANDTATILTVGADDTILMADAAAGNGLKWVASGTPVAVSTAAAIGTADTFARGDHVHAHEAAHVAHDTIWDAVGDLVVGTGADTAAKVVIGATGQVLTVVGGTAAWASNPGAGFVTQAKWMTD